MCETVGEIAFGHECEPAIVFVLRFCRDFQLTRGYRIRIPTAQRCTGAIEVESDFCGEYVDLSDRARKSVAALSRGDLVRTLRNLTKLEVAGEIGEHCLAHSRRKRPDADEDLRRRLCAPAQIHRSLDLSVAAPEGLVGRNIKCGTLCVRGRSLCEQSNHQKRKRSNVEFRHPGLQNHFRHLDLV